MCKKIFIYQNMRSSSLSSVRWTRDLFNAHLKSLEVNSVCLIPCICQFHLMLYCFLGWFLFWSQCKVHINSMIHLQFTWKRYYFSCFHPYSTCIAISIPLCVFSLHHFMFHMSKLSLQIVSIFYWNLTKMR